MFLRFNTRKKDGKTHRYWSVVENRRLRAGHTTQRTALYLGEINDAQEAAWRKSLDALNETTQRTEQVCLFPADRPLPPDQLNLKTAVGRYNPISRPGLAAAAGATFRARQGRFNR